MIEQCTKIKLALQNIGNPNTPGDIGLFRNPTKGTDDERNLLITRILLRVISTPLTSGGPIDFAQFLEKFVGVENAYATDTEVLGWLVMADTIGTHSVGGTPFILKVGEVISPHPTAAETISEGFEADAYISYFLL